MTTKTAIHRSLHQPENAIRWDEQSPLSMSIETRKGTVTTKHGVFVGGAADGVEVIEVNTGAVVTLILPTRGMAIWRMRAGDVEFGWQSPVAGPVHPSRVPVFDNSGLGWLEGFDELVVRCGLESNGAPQHDDAGHLQFPLHGRIGNLSAQSLTIEFNEASGRVEVIGEVVESRLFFKRLRLRSRTRFTAGSREVELLDDVTNELSSPATMQLLYHINVGSPVLGDGSQVLAPIERLAPKDTLSADEIETWNQMGPPQDGYAERVYFAQLRADENNLATAMIQSADRASGLAVTMNVTGLPRFILWKNTAAQSDGYVTGLEPATNFPNTRGYEQEQGRVVELEGGQTKSFRVTLSPLVDQKSVGEMADRVKKLQGDDQGQIESSPKPGWTPGA